MTNGGLLTGAKADSMRTFLRGPVVTQLRHQHGRWIAPTSSELDNEPQILVGVFISSKSNVARQKLHCHTLPAREIGKGDLEILPDCPTIYAENSDPSS